MEQNNSHQLYQYFVSLHISENLPNGISALNPYADPEVLRVNKLFFDNFYNDMAPRILLFGINPGRFGSGLTGIGFTDPITLEDSLSIPNQFEKKPELSATFIHKMIQSFGGAKDFFKTFLLTAVSPLGFIQQGININYYDDKELQKALLPFIKRNIQKQYDITGGLEICGCIGQGTNLKFLKELNAELKLFRKIVPLPHPRWVMQYRRKEVGEQIQKYITVLKNLKKEAHL
jgi:hypothetical protein